jgi:hypothetical protein
VNLAPRLADGYAVADGYSVAGINYRPTTLPREAVTTTECGQPLAEVQTCRPIRVAS